MALSVRNIATGVPDALAFGVNSARNAGQSVIHTFGTVTLASGTATVSSQPNIQKGSVIIFSITAAGGTLGANYTFVPTATGGGFTVTAVSSTGTTVTTDTSTLAWCAITPCYHADQLALTTGDHFNYGVSTTTVSAANAADLPTTLTLCTNIDGVLRLHLASTLVHKAADVTDVPANAVPIDLPSTITYLNDVKTKLNTHLASTAYHFFADGTNTLTAANAADLPTSITLANQIKSFLNLHMSIAPAGQSVLVLD